jgi:membrane protease subunit HflC
MRKYLLLIASLVIAIWLVRSSLFTVDRTEFVYLTQFGRPIATFDGANSAEAGLHFKWPAPIQLVQRLDSRLQYFDLPGAELLTIVPGGSGVDKTLTVDAYVCWRIAGKEGVDQFIRTVGTAQQARTILSTRISGELGAAIGNMKFEDLISTDANKVDQKRRSLEELLLHGSPRQGSGLEQRALADYGIQLVDVRLRRASHPLAARESIFDRIRSERNIEVAKHQSKAAKDAEEIKSKAEREVREKLARARHKEQIIKGQADAEATKLLNEAYAKDAQFYTFLKKLEEYQNILGDNKTTLLLSAGREMFDLLLQPPKPGGSPSKPADKMKGDGE